MTSLSSNPISHMYFSSSSSSTSDSPDDHHLHQTHRSSSISPSSFTTQRMPNVPNPPAILHLSFNQDQEYFAVGTTSDFRIFSCDPLCQIYCRENLPSLYAPAFPNSFGCSKGIGIVQMLFRSNLYVLVGGGPTPQYPLNNVIFWDDRELKCFQHLTFESEVKSVRLRRDGIVIVLSRKIFVYECSDLKKPQHQIQTVMNPGGLCEVSQTSQTKVLVCPGLQKGQVRVEHYISNCTNYIAAHDSSIACLGLTKDGRFLASASRKGTLIRVHGTLDGSLLQEFRRGADRAEIYSLAFSSTAQFLAASSDKGTIHVFNLRFNSRSLGSEGSTCASKPNNSSSSAGSYFSFIKGFLPKYFSSEWSVAQFHLQEGLQSIVAFGHQENTVVILGMDGSFYRCQFDPVIGGEMTKLEDHNFLKPEESF